MTAAYGTVCDGEICMVTGKEPSHIHPITFLVEKKKNGGFASFRTAVRYRAEGIWGSLGHSWVEIEQLGKNRVLMPQS